MREEEYKQLQKNYKKVKEKLKKTEEKYRRNRKEMARNNIIKRWKIGNYLHDELAQQLIAAKFSILFLKDELRKEKLTATCDEILDILKESISAVRDLSHDIIPMSVEKEGVGQAINQLKQQAIRQYGISCLLETDEILNKINSRKVATNLYQITQEAIKNAVIHGEAQTIKIALIEHEQQLYLHIKDDGKGFDPANKEDGMGIMIMEYRVQEIGGDFRIKDARDPDYTTCVTCSVPIKSLADD